MSLHEHVRMLSDEELLRRLATGGLTDEAAQIAQAEAASRGLALPEPAVASEPVYEGDWVTLERDLSPQEAQLLAGFLNTAGVTADTGDTQLVQAHALLSLAVGGARVRVPETRLAEARELAAAYRRGDFALDDDFDAGEAPR